MSSHLTSLRNHFYQLNIITFDCIPHSIVDSTARINMLFLIRSRAFRRKLQQPQQVKHDNKDKMGHLGEPQSVIVWYLIFSPHAFRKNQFLLTLWVDFGEIEGNKIEAKMEKDADLTVILKRSNIYYQEPTKYIIWNNRAKENKTMLLSHVSEKTSASSSTPPMMVTPVSQQVIPIAEIPSPVSMGIFYVEAGMAISNELQEFCLLEKLLNVQSVIGRQH
ncbi:hypothetical protein H5410_030754 [Solanum commersonii]|uniref:Uncharacterized protein n=1 Tax=Solanum commersonii TaxID=4109 RepID=A0A9J5YIB9_SOLCO|nr:hypothetical protein H5410_030754 [Solanum commersonii]